MADAEQAFRGPLTNAFQILRQRGGFLFGSHQAAVLFTEGSLAFLTPPPLVAVAGSSVLDALVRLAMGAVHAQPYYQPTNTSIPI